MANIASEGEHGFTISQKRDSYLAERLISFTFSESNCRYKVLIPFDVLNKYTQDRCSVLAQFLHH
ncbi:unnamed protein product [Ceratitis capitata]|uniref:(Mediterranean fruit fly) hypothetical protein n=1 Tax=Ceratitis capitata TaxID=7213 RepID=A0A811UX30_CERCA|nr:unnamed protein product [Ceratitis capitata]